MADYVALLSKDPDSDYGVDFPDFPGCVTAGETPEEARELALEALRLHIEGMIEDGEKIPLPSPLDKVTSDPANSDAAGVFPVRVADDLVTKEGQHRRPDGTLKTKGCDLSWKNVDTR
jgi:predicted RNase H-like HicB family nuclease